MDFKVMTCNMLDMMAECAKLQHEVEADGFAADAVIGVPSGGYRVTTLAFRNYKNISMELIRPPKGKLKKRAGAIIRLFPLWLRDRLRIWEAKKLVKKTRHMSNTTIVLPELDNNIKKVLIVDDAIDSGATLKAIMEQFTIKYPDIEVKSAVLTITGSNPVYRPDYCLYDEGILLRTPWSIDMR